MTYRRLSTKLCAVHLVGFVAGVTGDTPVEGANAGVRVVGAPELFDLVRGGRASRRVQQLPHNVRVDGMVELKRTSGGRFTPRTLIVED